MDSLGGKENRAPREKRGERRPTIRRHRGTSPEELSDRRHDVTTHTATSCGETVNTPTSAKRKDRSTCHGKRTSHASNHLSNKNDVNSHRDKPSVSVTTPRRLPGLGYGHPRPQRLEPLSIDRRHSICNLDKLRDIARSITSKVCNQNDKLRSAKSFGKTVSTQRFTTAGDRPAPPADSRVTHAYDAQVRPATSGGVVTSYGPQDGGDRDGWDLRRSPTHPRDPNISIFSQEYVDRYGWEVDDESLYGATLPTRNVASSDQLNVSQRHVGNREPFKDFRRSPTNDQDCQFNKTTAKAKHQEDKQVADHSKPTEIGDQCNGSASQAKLKCKEKRSDVCYLKCEEENFRNTPSPMPTHQGDVVSRVSTPTHPRDPNISIFSQEYVELYGPAVSDESLYARTPSPAKHLAPSPPEEKSPTRSRRRRCGNSARRK